MGGDLERSFQARIAELAQLLGSAQALADKAGLSRRVVGKYLAGESDPSRERLVALADAAGVNIEWLASGRGPMRGALTSPGTFVPIPVEDLPIESIRSWLADWWRAASSRDRVWLQVEMERHFPEYVEWKKKTETRSNGQCGS